MRRRGWLQPRGKRPPAMKRERFPEVTAPNQVWQMDVKAVALGDWGQYQTINVVDYHSRYWLSGILADNQRAKTLVRTLQLAVEEAERLGGWEGTVLVVKRQRAGLQGAAAAGILSRQRGAVAASAYPPRDARAQRASETAGGDDRLRDRALAAGARSAGGGIGAAQFSA
jgi:hypothetical protein